MNRNNYCKSIQLCLLFFIVSISDLTVGSQINVSEVDQWSVTQINSVKFNHLWIVKNFSLYREEEGQRLELPVFSVPTRSSSYNWRIMLYPRGFSNSKYLSAFVRYVSGVEDILKVDYKLSLLNSSYDEIVTKEASEIFDKTGSAFGLRELIDRSYALNPANNVLRNDELAIYVEITFYPTETHTNDYCNFIRHDKSEHSFSDSLKQYLMSSGLGSVTLEAMGGQQYPVPSVLLASRSSVFEKLVLASDATHNVIQTNIKPDLMPEFVLYLYNGRVDMEENAEEFLAISHAYALSDLKALAEESLCRSLNRENYARIALLADQYGAENLKRKAFQFIAAHLSSQGFRDFQKNHPELLIEMLRTVVNLQ